MEIKEMHHTMQKLHELVEEMAGERCEDYDPGCATCQMWAKHDILTNALDDVINFTYPQSVVRG